MAASSHLLVAAIDFGTTYSGWAFSFKHEYKTDPIKISAKSWPGGQSVSPKAPTCALIKPDGETLDSFGYEAESKYAELAGEGSHKEWYFFNRFKMMLFDQIGIKRDIEIEDASGKKFSAKKVFSLCIGYLRKDLIEISTKRVANGGLTEADFHWVLTVPAIWNDAAKQFMREAAEAPEAGIPRDKLTIALEPEAASIYCRHLPLEKCVGAESSFGSFTTGTKYLMIDAGGGTVDITVHEVLENGNLKELHKASGGPWGGTKVDDAFKTFLTKLFGGPVIAKFQESHMESYIDIFRSFEVKKREINPSKNGKITLTIPLSLFELVKEINGKSFTEVLQQTDYASRVTVASDKLRIEVDIIKELFAEPVKSVLDHVNSLLQEPLVRGCTAILMVGGFSESSMLQDSVRDKFPNLSLIVPEEAGLAVLKGAVIYGHNPTTIAERVCKYTYGIDVSHVQSGDCSHPPAAKTFVCSGKVYCADIFSAHIKMGQTVTLGDDQEEIIYYSVDDVDDVDDETEIGCDIFVSLSPNPNFVTESGCNKIGRFSVPLQDTTESEIGMSMKFGGTEIEVKVVEKSTENVTIKYFDFLG